MAKQCSDCEKRVGGALGFLRTGYECCDECGNYVCKRCAIDLGNKVVCSKCNGGGGCFIATACYGIESNEVLILRNWRDKKLSTNNIGKRFVNIYYKTSPPIASFISDKPRIKRIVRFGLKPLVRLFYIKE